MQTNRQKLKEMVLYACKKCRPSQLGAVKMHKVLYFADMLKYAESGHPMAGGVYRKRPFGPTCDELLPLLREMVAESEIQIKSENYFGYEKKEFHPKREPNLTYFNSDEIALLDEVIEFVCHRNSAKEISELSHSLAWESVEFGSEITYASVLLIYPIQVSQEAIDWASGEVAALEDKRSQFPPVGDVIYADFRKRVLEKGA